VRTIDYGDILAGTADLCGLDRDNLSVNDFKKLRTSHNNRLATGYEWFDWPELMRVEKRQVRPNYDSTKAYVVGDEVYYPAEDGYYQAVQAGTGNAPSNLAYWAEADRSHTPTEWESGKAYLLGDQVLYDDDDLPYHCLVAHTSSASVLPTGANWGRLYDFDPYISLEQTGETSIGTVYGLYNKDPRKFETVLERDWHLSANGIQFTDKLNKAWVEFRLRPPVLKGDTFSSTVIYQVGDQVYFSDANTPGNFFDCATATNVSDSPGTASAKWSKVEVPYIFGRFLIQAGYADYLAMDQQSERKTNEELFALELLTNQVTLLAGQQGHLRRVTVATR